MQVHSQTRAWGEFPNSDYSALPPICATTMFTKPQVTGHKYCILPFTVGAPTLTPPNSEFPEPHRSFSSYVNCFLILFYRPSFDLTVTLILMVAICSSYLVYLLKVLHIRLTSLSLKTGYTGQSGIFHRFTELKNLLVKITRKFWSLVCGLTRSKFSIHLSKPKVF